VSHDQDTAVIMVAHSTNPVYALCYVQVLEIMLKFEAGVVSSFTGLQARSLFLSRVLEPDLLRRLVLLFHVIPRVAAATALKTQEQGVAQLRTSPDELRLLS